MGHGHLSSHGLTLLIFVARDVVVRRPVSALSASAPAAAGDASQDGLNAPRGGVRVAILRRDEPHRHLVLSGGAERIVEGLRLSARERLTAASRWAGRGEAATSCTMESSPRALATVGARGGDGGDALREVEHAERELRGASSASWGGDAGAGKSASASAGVNGKWHAHVPDTTHAHAFAS